MVDLQRLPEATQRVPNGGVPVWRSMEERWGYEDQAPRSMNICRYIHIHAVAVALCELRRLTLFEGSVFVHIIPA